MQNYAAVVVRERSSLRSAWNRFMETRHETREAIRVTRVFRRSLQRRSARKSRRRACPRDRAERDSRFLLADSLTLFKARQRERRDCGALPVVARSFVEAGSRLSHEICGHLDFRARACVREYRTHDVTT